MKIIKVINPDNLSKEEMRDFDQRIAARAVVFDEDGKIALLNIQNHKFHTLPGGGVEEGEDIRETLDRECEEEIGCAIEVDDEIGIVIEHHKHLNRTQTSHFFLARVVGEKCEPKFTEDEIRKGFAVEWHTLKGAVAHLEEETHEDSLARSIIERDLSALKEVRKQKPVR